MSDSPHLRFDGSKLRGMRIEKRLTRPALSRKTGLHETHIYFLETGRRNASAISLGLLADALGCDEEDLTAGKPEPAAGSGATATAA